MPVMKPILSFLLFVLMGILAFGKNQNKDRLINISITSGEYNGFHQNFSQNIRKESNNTITLGLNYQKYLLDRLSIGVLFRQFYFLPDNAATQAIRSRSAILAFSSQIHFSTSPFFDPYFGLSIGTGNFAFNGMDDNYRSVRLRGVGIVFNPQVGIRFFFNEHAALNINMGHDSNFYNIYNHKQDNQQIKGRYHVNYEGYNLGMGLTLIIPSK
jgi:hypothetical protein